MSVTRLHALNAAQTATLDTTHGGSARHDDASGLYPIENALTPDRRMPWKSDGATNVVVVLTKSPYFDMTSVFLLGIETAGTLSQVVIDFSVNGTVWSNTVTVPLTGLRDAGAFVAAAPFFPVYIRFTFTNTGAFSIGRIFAGKQSDIAKVHSPGGATVSAQNRLERVDQDGSVGLIALAPSSASITLPFKALVAADRNVLQDVAAWPGTVVLFDTDDVVRECVVTGGKVKTLRMRESVFDCSMELVSLP